MESIKKQLDDCNLKSVAHRMTCDAYTEYSAYIKIPTLVLAVLATGASSVFAAIKSSEEWAQIIVTILSVLVLIFTSVGSWLAYGEGAEKHGAKARDFERLAQQLKKYYMTNSMIKDAKKDPYTDEQLQAKLEKVSSEYINIISSDGYPRLPMKFERAARQYIIMSAKEMI